MTLIKDPRCTKCGKVQMNEKGFYLSGHAKGNLCDDCAFKEPLICDFCSSPNPSYQYPCKTFQIPDVIPPYIFNQEWAACEICRELIEDEDYGRLLNRSMIQYRKDTKPLDDRRERLLYEKVGTIHALFRKNRQGPCEPITPKVRRVR